MLSLNGLVQDYRLSCKLAMKNSCLALHLWYSVEWQRSNQIKVHFKAAMIYTLFRLSDPFYLLCMQWQSFPIIAIKSSTRKPLQILQFQIYKSLLHCHLMKITCSFIQQHIKSHHWFCGETTYRFQFHLIPSHWNGISSSHLPFQILTCQYISTWWHTWTGASSDMILIMPPPSHKH